MAEIDDRVWRQMMGRLTKLDGDEVRVGLFGGGKNPKVGAFNEFGVRGQNEVSDKWRIQPRPWNAGTVSRNKKAYKGKMGAIWGTTQKGSIPRRIALEKFGLGVASDMKTTISRSIGLKPNLESTRKRKGSKRPLIDTGQMRRAITSKVVSR